jgi:hypothetical protein
MGGSRKSERRSTFLELTVEVVNKYIIMIKVHGVSCKSHLQVIIDGIWRRAIDIEPKLATTSGEERSQ